MKPTFALIHAENVNKNQDSICHLIVVPVVDGLRQPAKEFFFNPEAPFFLVSSGIKESDVKKFPSYNNQWPEVQSVLDRFDICMSSADGYAARSLYGTLSRLEVIYNPVSFCNAKAICRRIMNEVSYSFDYLNYTLYNDSIPLDEPVAIAERWTDIALRALENIEDESIESFLSRVKIMKGLISQDSFIPSKCIEDRSKYKRRPALNPSSIPVDPQPDNALYGMNVVFTGKMESMKRDDARAAVIRIGGFAPERLSMETDYLVVGVQDIRIVGEKGLSGKMKTAAKYKEKGHNIEIIDEQDFLEMLNAGN